MCCIDADGAWLDMGDIRRVIPADSAMKQQFQFGDPVYQVTVVKVEEDGTLVLQADGLELEDDNAAPGGSRKWKREPRGQWSG